MPCCYQPGIICTRPLQPPAASAQTSRISTFLRHYCRHQPTPFSKNTSAIDSTQQRTCRLPLQRQPSTSHSLPLQEAGKRRIKGAEDDTNAGEPGATRTAEMERETDKTPARRTGPPAKNGRLQGTLLEFLTAGVYTEDGTGRGRQTQSPPQPSPASWPAFSAATTSRRLTGTVARFIPSRQSGTGGWQSVTSSAGSSHI